MAAIQVGYGHGDSVGIPFDFYTNATLANGAGGSTAGKLATGASIVMQTAQIVFEITGALTVASLTLPLNPSDGAYCEIFNAQSSGGTLTLTSVVASAGDALDAGPATLAAGASAKYRYSLAGDITNGAGSRRWVRVA